MDPFHVVALTGAKLDVIGQRIQQQTLRRRGHTVLVVVAAMTDWQPHVSVVDSLGELLPMFGSSSNDSDEFTTVNRAVLTPIAASGTAVLGIDRLSKLSKNAESRKHGAGGAAAHLKVTSPAHRK